MVYKKKLNLLITCGAGIYTSSFIKSLKNQNEKFEFFFCDCDMNEVNRLKDMGMNISTIGNAENISSKKFLNDINKLIDKFEIDYLVPFSDAEAIFLKSSKFAMITIAAEKYLSVQCTNKYKLLNFLTSKKIIKTKFFVLNEIKDFETLKKYIDKTLFCIKPLVGRGGKGFNIIATEKNDFIKNNNIFPEKIIFFDDLKKRFLKNKALFGQYLVMEFITGHDFNIDCSADKGKLIDLCIQRRDKPSFGPIIQGEIVKDKIIYKFIKDLVQKLKLTGVFNIELILDQKEQVPIIYEINPRPSAGISFSEFVYPGFLERAINVLKKIDQKEILFEKLKNANIKREWENKIDIKE